MQETAGRRGESWINYMLGFVINPEYIWHFHIQFSPPHFWEFDSLRHLTFRQKCLLCSSSVYYSCSFVNCPLASGTISWRIQEWRLAIVLTTPNKTLVQTQHQDYLNEILCSETLTRNCVDQDYSCKVVSLKTIHENVRTVAHLGQIFNLI